MQTEIKKEILLESGTNELEILELGIEKDQSFGINVAKVREISAPVKVTKVPRSHPFISGLIQLRNEVLPVINLSRVLGLQELGPDEGSFIMTEFNQMKVVFHVGWVNQICRVSWDQIEKPGNMLQNRETALIGVIKLENKMIQLLDFEKILVEISPQTGISLERVQKAGRKEARKSKKIMIAEDSTILRNLVKDTLQEAGYEQLKLFENGKLAWDYLMEIGQEDPDHLLDHVELVITDIEMPQMDGLHLTKIIKDHSLFKQLPVIIFSSLISDSLRHKGESVGVDAQITKPEIDRLVNSIDRLLELEA